MSKKAPAPVKEETKPIEPAKLPAASQSNPLEMLVKAGASDELIERVGEVANNLESVADFRLPRMKMVAGGVIVREGDEPVQEIEFIILNTKAVKQYYDKPYNKNDPAPPTCYSLNGKVPSEESDTVQHETCKGCPQNEFGTNSMGSGKACRDLKPLYVLMSEESIIPRQLTISPTSLKAANNYLLDLTERGVSYFGAKTKIKFEKKDPNDTFVVAKFSMVSKLTEEKVKKDIKALRDYWLPVMNNQTVDAAETEESSASAAQPVDTKGEF